MNDVVKKTIDQLREACPLTGGAFATMEGDQAQVYCFGMADPETGRPATPDSFFDIASNSKAFTTMLGAIASDEGLFDWDAPISRYIKGFEMLDPYLTRHVSGRDMASHRTGVPRHDLMRTRVRGTRQDTVMRSAFMQMNRGFRETYQYNNQFYIVLGYALEQVYNKTWEELVAEKIAAPLGMEMRFRGPDCDLSGLDCALPHMTDGYTVQRCGYANSPVSGPCGGIRTNLKSLLQWLRCMKGKGAAGDVRLCSEKAWEELVTPCITSNAEAECAREKSNCYALAWHTSVYNGEGLVHHSGSVDGFNSRIGFFPELDKGFIFLTNTNGTPAPRVFQQLLCDRLTGLPQEDYAFAIEPWKNRLGSGDETRAQVRIAPCLEDTRYVGSFFHPAFDDFQIVEEAGRLTLVYGGFSAPLQVMDNGQIRAWGDDEVDAFWIDVALNEEGMVFECADAPGLKYQFVRMQQD